MKKERVLFLCVHNSARSQIAEAFFNQLCGATFEAMSAGIEPGELNPLAIEVMKEVGIDISHQSTTDVFELAKRGERFAYLVTVCDEAKERCPLFLGATERVAWSFPDPSGFAGTWTEKLEQTRRVRDQIKQQIVAWCEVVCA